MFFNQYTDEEKIEVSKQIKNYSFEVCTTDLKKLEQGVINGVATIKPLSLVGNKFVEYFTLPELLNTRSKQGISFYDFWYNKAFYMDRDDSTRRMIEYIKKEKPLLNEIQRAKKVFNMYYGSINVFRPATACRLYERFKPMCVLDFTMGWGGRMVGAHCSQVPMYIGIDNNERLKEPLCKMARSLTSHNVNNIITKFELLNQDCLTVDYSLYKYDMVFTSPPYYNKELYGATGVAKSEEEWDTEFYIPMFRKTWDYMATNGHYCLNIPTPLYEKICVPMFGLATECIELNKFSRTVPKRETVRKNVGNKYKEYIYVWVKE
jgi:16S rRNA G966 N2-methylase RsmD